MAALSGNDIRDAKRRVEEMRQRAQAFEAETAPSPADRSDTILQLYQAVEQLLQNDRRDVLLAVLLHLAADKEENVLLLTLLGILL